MKTILDDCYAAYVNLDKRPERRAGMEKALKQVGFKADRRRGVLPTEIKVPPEKIKAMWDRPQKGAIGCHFAQVSIMQTALLRNQHAFVMEDDLVFCSDFQERMKIITDFSEHYEWDIFWLGGTFHINPPYWHIGTARGCRPLGRDAELTFHSRIIRTFGCFCTYAYIVNKDSIQKIMDRIDQLLPTSIGIDHMMIMLQPDLFTFSFVPGCIKQYDHISDIGVDKYNRPASTTFSNFSKLGPYWWQDKLTDFDPNSYEWHEARRNT